MDNGFLCIGGCNADSCSNTVTLIKEQDGTIVASKDDYPQLPMPLANATGQLLDNKIYLAGGQEAMKPEQSTFYFLMLDLDAKEKGWQLLEPWSGEDRGYAVSVVQDDKFYLFSGRSYAPDTPTVMYTDGYVYDPQNGQWTRLEQTFSVMAGTAIPLSNNKIGFLSGVTTMLPTTADHPGFDNTLRIYDIQTNTLDGVSQSPYPIAVTTNTLLKDNTFYIASGEIRPGVRTPNILRGSINN